MILWFLYNIEFDAVSYISDIFNTPIVLNNITCDGSEEHILDCTNSETDTHNCSVGAAAVLCAGTIIRYWKRNQRRPINY